MNRGQSPWADAASLLGGKIRTIFDVGANVGQTCAELVEAFPASIIYAFEPVVSTFAELRANTARHERVIAHPFGFSDRARTEPMFVQLESGWNSLSKNIDRGLGAVTAQFSTVDEYCRSNAIHRIELLKIDTEGHEAAVLRGAASMLSRGAIDVAYCEVGFHREDRGHGYFCELLEQLRSFELQFYGLYGVEGLWFARHPVENSYPWSNALFVRDAIIQQKHGDDYARWWSSIQPGPAARTS